MPKKNAKTKGCRKQIARGAPTAGNAAAVKRVHQVMKLATSLDEAHYRKELAVLVDKLGQSLYPSTLVGEWSVAARHVPHVVGSRTIPSAHAAKPWPNASVKRATSTQCKMRLLH
jgi:hypothetical protein